MSEPLPHARRCWAEIDAAALRHNVAAIRQRIGLRVHVLAAVKADAYGHGLAHVVNAIARDVDMFGVANLQEARDVRALAPAVPVFIFGPPLPEERAEIVAAGFEPAISSIAEARVFAALAAAHAVRIHVKVDTGMGRIGIWQDEAAAAVREIASLRGVEIAGLATHLPVADEDDDFTRAQLARFHALAAELRSAGIACGLLHAENSAGALAFPELAGDMVRIGLALYGSSPRAEHQPLLRAALVWKTRVTLVREIAAGRSVSYGRAFIAPRAMRVATLAAGYADGYRRTLSGHDAEVLIGGQRCAVLGRVTMDQIVADVSALPQVHEGDDAVLLGRQGAEEITATELAHKAGTIAWEIFTGIGARVERVAVSTLSAAV